MTIKDECPRCGSETKSVKYEQCAVMGYENPWHTGANDKWAPTAFLQGIDAVARVALGNGLDRDSVAHALRDLADAIDGTSDVPEDMSEISIPMC